MDYKHQNEYEDFTSVKFILERFHDEKNLKKTETKT